MKRVAFFIDGSETPLSSVKSAMLIADHTGSFLDVHHPWASRKNLAGSPGWRPVSPENVVSSGRASARELFHKACGDRQNARFVGVDGYLADAIRSFGVAYDLIIVDRLAEEMGRKPYAFNAALFESGTPVLVVPPTMPLKFGKRIAVIWSGTCQSGRALRAGIPYLKKAEEVLVLTNTVNPMAYSKTAEDYLAVQGIKCESKYFDGSGLTARGRGRALINTANSLGADMLIMGAFGFNGIEGIFDLGGATRKLVTATPVPLLMQS